MEGYDHFSGLSVLCQTDRNNDNEICYIAVSLIRVHDQYIRKVDFNIALDLIRLSYTNLKYIETIARKWIF